MCVCSCVGVIAFCACVCGGVCVCVSLCLCFVPVVFPALTTWLCLLAGDFPRRWRRCFWARGHPMSKGKGVHVALLSGQTAALRIDASCTVNELRIRAQEQPGPNMARCGLGFC